MWGVLRFKRRNLKKKLTVHQRNLLLTGDPHFAFDPIVYDTLIFYPRRAQPQILVDIFGYLFPEIVLPSDSDSVSNPDS